MVQALRPGPGGSKAVWYRSVRFDIHALCLFDQYVITARDRCIDRLLGECLESDSFRKRWPPALTTSNNLVVFLQSQLVPEPSSVVLMGLGAVALAAVALRRMLTRAA